MSIIDRMRQIGNEQASLAVAGTPQIRTKQQIDDGRIEDLKYLFRESERRTRTIHEDELSDFSARTTHLLGLIGAREQLEEVRDQVWGGLGDIEYYSQYEGDRRSSRLPIFAAGYRLFFQYKNLSVRALLDYRDLTAGDGISPRFRVMGGWSGGYIPKEYMRLVKWSDVSISVYVTQNAKRMHVASYVNDGRVLGPDQSGTIPHPRASIMSGIMHMNDQDRSYSTLQDLLAQSCIMMKHSPTELKELADKRLRSNGFTEQDPTYSGNKRPLGDVETYHPRYSMSELLAAAKSETSKAQVDPAFIIQLADRCIDHLQDPTSVGPEQKEQMLQALVVLGQRPEVSEELAQEIELAQRLIPRRFVISVDGDLVSRQLFELASLLGVEDARMNQLRAQYATQPQPDHRSSAVPVELAKNLKEVVQREAMKVRSNVWDIRDYQTPDAYRIRNHLIPFYMSNWKDWIIRHYNAPERLAAELAKESADRFWAGQEPGVRETMVDAIEEGVADGRFEFPVESASSDRTPEVVAQHRDRFSAYKQLIAELGYCTKPFGKDNDWSLVSKPAGLYISAGLSCPEHIFLPKWRD